MAEIKTSDQFELIWQIPLPWEMLDNANILIVGATGLIGSTLVRTLIHNPQKQYRVYALGRNIEKLKKVFNSIEDDNNLILIEGDITKNLDYNIDFQYIIDCASNATPYGFKNKPVETICTNIIGVNNLLYYGLQHRLKRFLYVSTGEVYGEDKDKEFSEIDSGYINNLNPRSCYPASKRAAENLCAAYKYEYNVDVVIARPCHIYGPYFLNSDDRAYAQFFRKGLLNEDIVLNSPGLLKRSWCYVLDCITALLYILLKGKSGEAYNISDKPYTIKDFASKIAKAAGVKITYDIDKFTSSHIITQGVLSSEKLRHLGWYPIANIENNIDATLNELKYRLKDSDQKVKC